MAIDKKSVTAAFFRISPASSGHDLPAIDAYVLDNGGSNYNNAQFGLHDEEQSGQTDNQTVSVEVNNKFDFDLTNLAESTK